MTFIPATIKELQDEINQIIEEISKATTPQAIDQQMKYYTAIRNNLTMEIEQFSEFKAFELRKTRKIKHYQYGMIFRGYSIGCQPKQGLIKVSEDIHNVFHDILIYNRKLTDEEIKEYELEFIGSHEVK